MSMNSNRIIRGITPSLSWLGDLLSFFQVESISIPNKYRDRVLAVKRALNDDSSGLAGSLLDFAINSALVDYTIETDNENLTEALNSWLGSINESNRGKIPTGLNALAKEYFRERWKGSSNLLLRTFWDKKDGLILPTTMFFLDGEDIKVETGTDDGVLRLGDENYYIRVGDSLSSSRVIGDKDIKLPTSDSEVIFSQKPFESWGVLEPTPFLIKRGIYRNMKFAALMSQKGEFIVSRALEYMMIVKKGTERMALEGNVTYDEDELKNANEQLKEILARKKNEPGFPSFMTNFDTDVSEYIPEYKKAINAEIYGAIEAKILAGLGFIDISASAKAQSRREGQLNPKPFFGEVEQGITDFKALLNDILKTIVEKNDKRKKWMSSKIKIVSSPISQDTDNDAKVFMRSLYDRGLLSKETTLKLLGKLDLENEALLREKESRDGLDEKMYAPVIQNNEGQGLDVPGQNPEADVNPSPKKKTLPDRTGPEAKNFNKSELDGIQGDEYLVTAKEFEQAPYNKTADLPKSVKVLPSEGQSLWMRVFNQSFPKGEDYARRVAWSVVKEHFKRSPDGKWSAKGSVEDIEIASVSPEEIKRKIEVEKLQIIELEILQKKRKLLDKLLGDDR